MRGHLVIVCHIYIMCHMTVIRTTTLDSRTVCFPPHLVSWGPKEELAGLRLPRETLAEVRQAEQPDSFQILFATLWTGYHLSDPSVGWLVWNHVSPSPVMQPPVGFRRQHGRIQAANLLGSIDECFFQELQYH